MITYDFILYIRDSNQRGEYSLKLNANQEDYPESIFTPEIKNAMKRKLQQDTSSRINDVNLNKIITTWIQDIKEGFRQTSMTLDLPSLSSYEIELLEESGYQNLPDIIPPDLTDIEPQIGCLPPLNFV